MAVVRCIIGIIVAKRCPPIGLADDPRDSDRGRIRHNATRRFCRRVSLDPGVTLANPMTFLSVVAT